MHMYIIICNYIHIYTKMHHTHIYQVLAQCGGELERTSRQETSQTLLACFFSLLLLWPSCPSACCLPFLKTRSSWSRNVPTAVISASLHAYTCTRVHIHAVFVCKSLHQIDSNFLKYALNPSRRRLHIFLGCDAGGDAIHFPPCSLRGIHLLRLSVPEWQGRPLLPLHHEPLYDLGRGWIRYSSYRCTYLLTYAPTHSLG